jgi:hypothetical protein
MERLGHPRTATAPNQAGKIANCTAAATPIMLATARIVYC